MYLEKLKSLSFFEDIDTDISKLAEYSIIKNYNKKQLIFLHNDDIKYFYIVLSGWVQLFRDTADGQEALIGLATANNIICTVDFNQKLHLFSAKTIHETELLLLPHDIFKKTIEQNGKLALKIIKDLNSTISLLELQLEHASTMNAAQRIGCFILRLTNNKQTQFVTTLPCDKTIIASYLGMKRETFSRALSDLRSVGVEVEGQILIVNNIQKLISFCCISCSLTYDSCKTQN